MILDKQGCNISQANQRVDNNNEVVIPLKC